MSMANGSKRGGPRQEKAARSAFYVWIAVYAAVTIAIVAVNGLGDTPSRAGNMPTRQDAAAEPLDHTSVGSIPSSAHARRGD